ncbi:MAG: hypothetical protein MI757_22425, partial [Pirellulales bacterium]|nr:hypothetical protein [Pirellulales bacterium]
MSDDFDPYYKWLAIPPEEQPPNYYRLLGLRLFESDHDVIGNAADARMLQIRSYQSGARAKESQRILKEISAARVCLLRAETREEYDAGLRTDLRVLESGGSDTPAPPPAAPPTERPPLNAASAAAPPQGEPSVRVRSTGTIAPPIAEEQVVEEPMVVAPQRSRVATGGRLSGVRSRRKSNPLIPIVILGAVALLLVFVAIQLTRSNPAQLKVKGIEDHTVRIGEEFSIRAEIADDELWEERIRWRLEDPPEGAKIDRESGEVTWEPRRAGKFSFRVIATSDGNSDD